MRFLLAGGFLSCLGALAAPVSAAADPNGAAASTAPSAETCAESVARRLQDHYDDVRDLTARFDQTTHSVTLGTGSGGAAMEAKGTVVFAKPGKMRWSYEEPDPSLVVSDGKALWLYDPQAREAQRMQVSEGFLSGAAIQFLLGEGQILEEFEVRAEECGSDTLTRVRLELRPRTPASYERLELLADPRTGQVYETTVRDLFGNVTRVRLFEVQTNQGPDAQLFRFDPPEDVRVLEIPRSP
jgi:outer membrane lipoprotein carrier protein